MTDGARRGALVLSDADEARLVAAHRDLKSAAKAHNVFLGDEPATGEAIPSHDVVDMRAGQATLQAAEDELWRLRGELLGWVRPSWAPSAALTAGWFCDEDAVYDDLPETASP